MARSVTRLVARLQRFQTWISLARMAKMFFTMGVLVMLFNLSACSSKVPKSVGLVTTEDGTNTLQACPDKPNCVTSIVENSPSQTQYASPLETQGDPKQLWEDLVAYLKSNSRVEILIERERYIHSVFSTRLLGFKDDVEFLFREGGPIHFRSASRIGHYDLGANKKRIEEIRSELSANQP